MNKEWVSIFSVTAKTIIGHGKAKVKCVPEPDSFIDIRFETGDIVELIEGDDDIVPEVEGVPDGAFRWN